MYTMSGRRLACLAFLGQSGPVLGHLFNVGLHHNKTGDDCALSDYPVLCQVGKVRVLLGEGNSRLLQFGDECATETEVVCKGTLDRESSCQSDCGSCPCDFDADAKLSASYMRTMFGSMEKLCSSADETRVLVVGLGGGEFSQYLLHKCPNTRVDAIELSEDVISAARSYFGLKQAEDAFGDRLNVEQADALAALQLRDEGSYDAVVIDCFAGGGIVPESCRSREFAESVRRVLKPSGALLQNMWRMSPGHPRVSSDFKETMATYKDVFQGSVEDIRVPMPIDIDFVSMIKASLLEGGKDEASYTDWLSEAGTEASRLMDPGSGQEGTAEMAALQVGKAAALRRQGRRLVRLSPSGDADRRQGMAR